MLTACSVRLQTPGGTRAPETPISETDVATHEEVATFDNLGSEMCRAAGGSEEDNELVWLSLARAAFFETNKTELSRDGRAIVLRVAEVAASLHRDLEIDVHLEDDARSDAERIARERAATIRAIVDAREGGPQARWEGVRVVAHAEMWEGSYDGPAALDPVEGRIDFVLTTKNGRALKRPPKSPSPRSSTRSW